MIKAVIFDFDGVLVESLDIKTYAFGKLFEKEGKDLSEKVMKYHVDNSGVSRYEKIRYIHREMLNKDLDDITFDLLCDRFSDLVLEAVVKAPYVRGALDFLEKYGNEYSFFICSATPLEELKKIIERRGMTGFFKRIYGAPVKKKDIVSNILEEEEFSRNEVVYVGDALSDYTAARENGIYFIGRKTPDKTDIFINAGCPIIDDLSVLSDEIQRSGETE